VTATKHETRPLGEMCPEELIVAVRLPVIAKVPVQNQRAFLSRGTGEMLRPGEGRKWVRKNDEGANPLEGGKINTEVVLGPFSESPDKRRL